MDKKDNVLKKEFKQKDVQRLRNLLTKNYVHNRDCPELL